MKPNMLKKCFLENRIAHGTFCSLKDPAVIEMIGITGYDFVILEMEHTSMNLSEVQDLIRAAEVVGITPIVRVPQDASGSYLRVAELGAPAVLVPHVRTAKMAQELVNAIKYPPIGDRGMSAATRANDYGVLSMKEHMEKSNQEIMAMIMIEDLEAVDNLEEILSVPGLDLVFVGPADLSRSCGVPSEMKHPKVRKVIEHIFETAKKYPHIKIGIPSFQIEDIPDTINLGANLITCPPSDVRVLFSSLKQSLEDIKATYQK